MKPFRNPYRYQGGWAWIAPVVSAVTAWWGNRQAKKARVTPQSEAAQSVLGRVEGAKAAGLHPLAALGTPSSAGTSMQMNDFSSLGDSVQGAVNSYTQQRQWKQELAYQRAQEANSRSQQMNQDMREQARLNADLAMTNKQMSWIDEQIRASQEESLRRSMAATPGLRVPVRAKPSRSNTIPDQYVPVKDRFGNVQYVPNPDFYDLELPSSIGAATLAKPEIQQSGFWQTLKNKYYDFDRQRRAIDAANPRLNPYGLPPSIGD